MSQPTTDPGATNPAGQEYPDLSAAATVPEGPALVPVVPIEPAPVAATRRRGPRWLLLLLGAIVLAVVVWGFAQCGSSAGQDAGWPGAPAAGNPDVHPNPADPAATGVLTVGGDPLFPLAGATDPNGALTAFVGDDVTGEELQVLSVPANEGFWAGNNNTDRVWVETGPARQEPPLVIRQGEIVGVSGEMVAHGPDFAAQNGVDAAAGAEQLTRQAAHVEASRVQILGAP